MSSTLLVKYEQILFDFMKTFTALEIVVIDAILHCEFNQFNGRPNEVVNEPIVTYVSSVLECGCPKQLRGAITSLVKKGIVTVDNLFDDDSTISLVDIELINDLRCHS